MKRQLRLLAVFTLAAFVLSGCAFRPSKQRTVRLRGNESKGYTWDYATEKDDVINEVDRAYRDGNVPGSTGAPGLFLFTFEGAGEGETRVYFHYVDKNDESNDALSTVVYDVKVGPDGKITSFEPVGTFLEVEGVQKLADILEQHKSGEEP